MGQECSSGKIDIHANEISVNFHLKYNFSKQFNKKKAMLKNILLR